MFGKKLIVKRLEAIELAIIRLINSMDADQRLLDQNKELMDRLMSRNWESYATYSPDVHNRIEAGEDIESDKPIMDEGNAGEILSDEDLGIQSS